MCGFKENFQNLDSAIDAHSWSHNFNTESMKFDLEKVKKACEIADLTCELELLISKRSLTQIGSKERDEMFPDLKSLTERLSELVKPFIEGS